MKHQRLIRLFSLILAFALFLPLTVSAKAYPKEDEMTSTHVAVINADNGFLVYQKNVSERIPVGDAARLMTALLALEHFEGRLETKVTVPTAATRGLEGSAVLNLKPEEEIPVIDLLHAVLVAGMTDAANTLAFAVGGTLKDFIAMMNAKALEIGASDTFFTNATGMASAAFTTAADLARIAFYAYQNDLFMEICSKRFYTVAETNQNPAVMIYAKNPLVMTQSQYYYAYAEGMSAGYSKENGAQIISAVSYGTYPYICVAVGSKETNGTVGGYSEVKSLLAWASYNFAERKILDTSKILCEMPVRAGRNIGHVLVVPKKNVYAFLDVDTDLSAIELHESLRQKKLTAPVSKGDIVGSVTIVLDGEPIGHTDLVAKANVLRSTSGAILLGLEAFFLSPFFLVPAAALLIYLALFIYKHHKKPAKSIPKNRRSHAIKTHETANNKNNHQ
jgi:D-alanyl-D-alanine carboxypeptidase (penicillin-binding protein 5/6)